MKLIRQVSLLFQQGRSDKVYEVDLCDVGSGHTGGSGRFVVNFRYGRRGSNLRDGSKTPLPVSLEKAEALYDKLVQEKLRKGYVDTGAASPTEQPMPVAAPPTTPGPSRALSPREAHLLAVLRHPASAPGDMSLSRAAWMAGELRLAEAVPGLVRLAPSRKGLELISISWALARIATPGCEQALQQLLANNKAPPAAHRNAEEGLRAVLDGPRRASLLEGWRRSLPEPLKTACQRTPEHFAAAFTLWLSSASPGQDGPDQDALRTLYLLDTPAVRPALLEALRSTPLQPGSFRALRHIFKAAELRADGQVFGLLARRFELTRRFFHNSRWGPKVWIHPHGRLDYKKELQQPDSRLAWSEGTRRWFRRRCWRTLRRLGRMGSADYAPMAAGLLLAWADGDGQTPRTIRSYSWGGSDTVTWYSAWGRLWAFNQVLYQNSRRHATAPRTLGWRTTVDPEQPVPDRREEAFPERWDAHPQVLVQLLRESRCEAVQRFAALALAANTRGQQLLSIGDLLRFLDGPYTHRAALAVQVAVARHDPNQPDLALVSALLDSAHPQARAQAQSWVQHHPSRYLGHAPFVVRLVMSPQADTRQLAQQLLVIANLSPALALQVVQLLLKGVAELDPERPDAEARCRDAGTLLLAVFGTQLELIDPALLIQLAQSPSPVAQELAGRILVQHPLPAEELPDELLAALMTSSHAGVRSAGVRLFGQLPDATLLQRYSVLLHLAANPLPDVREAVRPLITRLAQGHVEFADALLPRIIQLLQREESHEGLHADLVALARQAVPAQLDALNSKGVHDLLMSPSSAAQELGGQLLGSNLDPSELSIRQLAELASHEVLAVRQAAMAMALAGVELLKAEPEESLRLLDARWEDSRQAAFALLEQHFGDEQLTPDLLVALCDGVRPDVQAFGRRMITQRFERRHGWRYLARLAQHPSPDMQLFASNYLQRFAAGRSPRVFELEGYFTSVLLQVNRGRVARLRVFEFLAGEAAHCVESAQVAARVLNKASLSAAAGDRARAIAILTDIHHRWPDIPLALQLSAPETRPRRAV